MAKQKSRPKRWAEACSEASEALGELEASKSKFEDAMDELISVQQEYSDWKDNLPENLASGSLGEKLEEVCNLDLESAKDSLSGVDDARSTIDEAEAIDLPQGFGRD